MTDGIPKLFLILLLAAVSEQEKVECEAVGRHSCRVEALDFPRSVRNYSVSSQNIEKASVQDVQVVSSRLSVLTSAFCDAFPSLQFLSAQGQGIEVLDQDAFGSCQQLQVLRLQENLIQVVPQLAFRGTPKLRFLYLSQNRLESLPGGVFEATASLFELHLGDNQLGSFPPELVRNTSELTVLSLHSNNIIDFRVEEILKLLPKLEVIGVRQNLFPCSRVPAILEALKAAGVDLEEEEATRERVFTMSEVESVSCIKGH